VLTRLRPPVAAGSAKVVAIDVGRRMVNALGAEIAGGFFAVCSFRR